MASGNYTGNQGIRPYLNFFGLLTAGGIISIILVIPILIIAEQPSFLGPVWVGIAGALGIGLGGAALLLFRGNRWWWRASGAFAILLGVIALGSTVNVVFSAPPILAGLLAVGAVFHGTLGAAPAPQTKGALRIIIILAAVILGGMAFFSISGALWSLILEVSTDVLTFLFNPHRIDPATIVQCRADSGCSTIQAIVFSLVFFFVILTGFAYTTLLERKLIAWFQVRSGPNRVGPFGLLQPAADGVKLIFKEDILPSGADVPVYRLAPILKAVPALIVLAVIPLGPDLLIPWFNGLTYQVPLGLADVNVGVLWVLAITSIGTYGVVLAGWASNNKYAMLGGLRATAQMLSYELSLGLTMAVPILIVGSMSLGDIIRNQTMIYEWFVFQNPLAAGILMIALLAEVNRSPFDLPEAEQELTQGFMTEYSGMKFAMFMMAEYLGMIAVSVIVAALFFGGYHDGFGLVNQVPILGPLVFIGKVVLFLIGMIWVRATLPRIRYDRLMALGWKVLLPLALVAVFWSAVSILIGDLLGSPFAYAVVSGAFFVVVVGGGFWLLNRSGTLEETEERFEDDPVITGERRGLGWMALQVLGGIIAIPFGLWNFTLSQLDNLAKLAGDDESDQPPPSSNLPVKTDGGS